MASEAAKRAQDRWQGKNPGVALARATAWRQANPERYAENMRRAKLLRVYGLSLADYDHMLAAQGNGCAICHGINKNGRRLAVDHDHATGAVRGLLCETCNHMLGNAKDDPGRLAAGIQYLVGR